MSDWLISDDRTPINSDSDDGLKFKYWSGSSETDKSKNKNKNNLLKIYLYHLLYS